MTGIVCETTKSGKTSSRRVRIRRKATAINTRRRARGKASRVSVSVRRNPEA